MTESSLCFLFICWQENCVAKLDSFFSFHFHWNVKNVFGSSMSYFNRLASRENERLSIQNRRDEIHQFFLLLIYALLFCWMCVIYVYMLLVSVVGNLELSCMRIHILRKSTSSCCVLLDFIRWSISFTSVATPNNTALFNITIWWLLGLYSEESVV